MLRIGLAGRSLPAGLNPEPPLNGSLRRPATQWNWSYRPSANIEGSHLKADPRAIRLMPPT
jgi:hypothetical protein